MARESGGIREFPARGVQTCVRKTPHTWRRGGAGTPRQQDLDKQVAANRIHLSHFVQLQLARSVMLAFLNTARCGQLSTECLEQFFADRVWPESCDRAVGKALEIGRATSKNFMFLTVTNKAAADINTARITQEFSEEARERERRRPFRDWSHRARPPECEYVSPTTLTRGGVRQREQRRGASAAEEGCVRHAAANVPHQLEG